jgi:hypothetical protein
MLRGGAGYLLTSLTVFFALALGVIHWMARPHVFTLLGAAVTMALIGRARDARSAWSAVWPTALLFALWGNLHGGFLYGLCLIAAVVVGERLEMMAAPEADQHAWRGPLTRHVLMLGAAALAVLANPVGAGIYTHTIGYLHDTYLLDHTQEYLSPDFHTARFALLAIVGTLAVLLALPRRVPFPTTAIVTMNLAFALDAVRNLPFWGVVVLPVVAMEVAPYLPVRWHRPVPPRWWRLAPVYPALALGAMLVWASHGTPRFPSTFNPSNFPVAAVRAAQGAHLPRDLYSEFTWGGYVLYAWPGERVFIDGQTDFYGDSIMQDYRAVHALTHGWRDVLSKWDIRLAIVETHSPLADAFDREPGWSAVYRDSTATTFVRGHAP